MDLVGGRLAHYKILRRLGAGGMGVVYLALDERLGRQVAIKVLSSDLAADREHIARLGAEARTLAAVDHPGIVTVHAVEDAPWSADEPTQDGDLLSIHFLVMEAVDGTTLTELITATGTDPQVLTKVGSAVAEALAAAHERGVVHRDLKPGNVMLSESGRVKVLDFGLARRFTTQTVEGFGDAPTLPETQAGWLAGTPPYMAPEQLRGEPVTPATDVFALGVLLFEMACGSRPFAGRTPAELVGAILHSEPDWRRIDDDVALPGLAKLLRELLAKQPADRPSALEIARRLKSAGQGDAGTTQVRTLAVLPFADLSAARDQQYFCDGLVDELLTALAAVPELQVISRTAVGRFRESELDLKDIGERLGVEHLVEGSVRKAGERLRVSVRLLASESGFQLWAERYNRDLEDIFAVQEEIAERIVEALAVSLGPRQRSALARSSHRAYTGDTRAYDAYLRGRALLTGFDRSDHLASARAQFESALERDSAYAPALAALARLEAETYRNVSPDRDILARADHLARRALALAPDLAEAHTALGKVLGARYDYAGAAQRFRRAATLQPDDPVAWDELSWALGYVQPAEPLEAERAAREALRLQPDMVGAHYHLSRALLLQGRLDEAEAAVLQARDLDPSFDSTHLGLAQVALARGDPSRARAELSQLTRLAELPIALVLRAQVEVADDQEDAAMQLLRHAISRGYRDLAFLRLAPDFKRLREHRDWSGLFDFEPAS